MAHEMAHQWQGIIAEYRDRLPAHVSERIVTLGEGGTPLVEAPALSARTGAQVFVKVEGMNPTGSFKDRGMTTAISAAAGRGAQAVVCASTGNTSASAAAYAVRAGMTCAVLVPDGKIAMGKLSQAIAHGARLLQVDGNFDDCLVAARKLAEAYPVELVNSVNPDRIEGQKTGAFEIVDALGDAPDIHALPVGNAGNITAYWKGFREYAGQGVAGHAGRACRPSRRARRRCGASRRRAPRRSSRATRSRSPRPSRPPSASATPRRGSSPRPRATSRAASSRPSPTSRSSRRTASCRARSACSSSPRRPPASPGSSRAERGLVPAGARIVVTVTGHGLKDPQWALRTLDGTEVQPTRVTADVVSIADALGLD